MACIGILGPDFLFGLAAGQLSSALHALRLFRSNPAMPDGKHWTLSHCFFVDMGGYFVTSIDFEKGFPIDAQQLYYLVKQGHLDFPKLIAKALKDMECSDTLTRIITMWQVLWFSIAAIQRVRVHLPLTTLEVTTLSFSFTMICTSFCWFYKPHINAPLEFRLHRPVEEIRSIARETTYPGLPMEWYRTPFDFICRREFVADSHWIVLCNFSHLVHLPIVSRRMRMNPWDQIPDDNWKPIMYACLPIGSCVLFGMSVSFVCAWNFHFPTETEEILWRVSSCCHLALTIFGGMFYLIGAISYHTREKKGVVEYRLDDKERSSVRSKRTVVNDNGEDGQEDKQDKPAKKKETSKPKVIRTPTSFFRERLAKYDPYVKCSLMLQMSVALACVVYAIFQMILYIEDFASLRSQSKGTFVAVNSYLPFLGM